MPKNEINDLYNYGFKIVQNPSFFKFSLDSILLADFVNLDLKDKSVLDLCTGNAPIPIILSTNNKLKIYGMELQQEVYKLAAESINLNKITNVKIINDNIKNWNKYFPANNFDIITCNPPYFKVDEKSITNQSEIKTIARHEVYINLEEIISISNNLLRNQGKFYLVYRTERLIELITLLNNYKFLVEFCFSKNTSFYYKNLQFFCKFLLAVFCYIADRYQCT